MYIFRKYKTIDNKDTIHFVNICFYKKVRIQLDDWLIAQLHYENQFNGLKPTYIDNQLFTEFIFSNARIYFR